MTVEKLKHDQLVEKAKRWLLRECCTLVITELATGIPTGETPDAWGWHGSEGGYSMVVECKTSKADFRADTRNKYFRRGHYGMGHERFYLAPWGLIAVEQLPNGWGLLEVTPTGGVEVTKWSAPFRWSAHHEIVFVVSAVRRFHFPDLGIGLRAYSDKMHGGSSENPKATLTVELAEEVTS
jgi:hypothetical protein